ncbi:nucleotidyltransferase domain-containing protein [Candidatus Micrarchaeota archaeon]|nr:nucleotidyltransferase domain-containing protein [Candidatus Micrarchaeota archaeon]
MLERLLRSKAEVKVLGIVLFEDGLHLREIARRAGVSPYEAKRELEILTELNILLKEKRGNQLAFNLNKACPFLHDLKKLYQKTEGVIFKLQSVLQATGRIKYAFIFGSSAREQEKKHSDIDILVIGDVNDETLANRIFEIQKEHEKAINFILWSEKDFEEKIKKKGSFLTNILKKKIIWLVGEKDEFSRIVKEGFSKKSGKR